MGPEHCLRGSEEKGRLETHPSPTREAWRPFSRGRWASSVPSSTGSRLLLGPLPGPQIHSGPWVPQWWKSGRPEMKKHMLLRLEHQGGGTNEAMARLTLRGEVRENILKKQVERGWSGSTCALKGPASSSVARV